MANKVLLVIILTVIISMPAFIGGHLIWPPAPGVMPTPEQLPFYVFLSIVESLLFGFGISFLFLALPYIRNAPKVKKARTIWAFISLEWLLLSWWPHDNLHMHIGLDLERLLGIEYGFHLTIMIATLIIANYFYKEIKM